MSNPHWYSDYYVQMWTRFPPYLFGIILGWILHRTKGSQLKMNKVKLNLLCNLIKSLFNYLPKSGCGLRWLGIGIRYWSSSRIRFGPLPRSKRCARNRQSYSSCLWVL